MHHYKETAVVLAEVHLTLLKVKHWKCFKHDIWRLQTIIMRLLYMKKITLGLPSVKLVPWTIIEVWKVVTLAFPCMLRVYFFWIMVKVMNTLASNGPPYMSIIVEALCTVLESQWKVSADVTPFEIFAYTTYITLLQTYSMTFFRGRPWRRHGLPRKKVVCLCSIVINLSLSPQLASTQTPEFIEKGLGWRKI